MAFCIALAVRDMRMTVDEAMLAATAGGAGAAPRRHRPARAGLPRRSRDPGTPSPAHLAYRPGVPLIAATLVGGRVEFVDERSSYACAAAGSSARRGSSVSRAITRRWIWAVPSYS